MRPTAHEWADWAHGEICFAGELPAWLEADPGVALAVKNFDGEDDAITDVWAAVEFAISEGRVSPPATIPQRRAP